MQNPHKTKPTRNKSLTQLAVNQAKAPATGFTELWHRRGLHLRVGRSGKVWLLRYRFGDRQRRLELGRAPEMTLAQAEAAAAEKLATARSGVDPTTAAPPAPKPQHIRTVKRAFDAYAAQYCARNLRPRTWAEVERTFRLHVLPAIGDGPIAGVTRADIKTLVASIAESGRQTYANRLLAYVRAFFGWAESEDFLQGNPAGGIKPARETSRDRTLSDSEIKLFWTAAGRVPAPYGDFFRLLLLTAQRRENVAAMEWGEIDRERNTWTIPAARMKAGIVHDAHLSAPALEILAGALRCDPRYIFSRVTGKSICGFSDMKERLDAIITELNGGEPLALWRIHDLRRTAATIMARLKVSQHVVNRILAHQPKGVSGVAAVYNRHEYLDERREALEALGTYVIGLVSPA